ncbi:MAG: penicillin-binding protein 2 [Actinomycetes bacterium]
MANQGLPPQASGPVVNAPMVVRLDNPRRRIRTFTILLMIFMLLCIGQLVNLQIIRGPELAAQAENSRLQTFVVPALRGQITDINGNPIAMSIKARDVTADQTLVGDPHKTAVILARYLKMPVKKIQKRLTGKLRFSYVARNITPELWDKIAAEQLKGILSQATSSRIYPEGDLAASLLGFTGYDGRGLVGLEEKYDDWLSGKDGKQTVEMVNGTQIPTGPNSGIDAIDGGSIKLTIDDSIQAVAERALARQVIAQHAVGGDVVVMDPKTFQILAMATYPTYNPNKPEKYSPDQQRNSAVQDSFEPGSTSKVMTMSAVIEEGALKPTSKLVIPPTIRKGGTNFHDHEPHGTLHLTLNGVLALSSNIGSIIASNKIGQDKFLGYLQKFGVGQLTGSNIYGEASGSLPNPKNENEWSDTTFPTLAFGQGLSVTALQVASIYSTIANNGVRLTPQILAGTTSNVGVYTPAPPPTATRVVSAKTARIIREMLESVVSAEGTAPAAQIPGYRVAGKTGTANRSRVNGPGYSGYTASFVGMAPAENPALVVAVMIHTPGGLHFGSLLSGPVFREVMMYSLAHRKVPPSSQKRPKIAVKW